MGLNDWFEAAMKVETQAEADALLSRILRIVQSGRSTSPEETERSVRSDIAYYAGYHSLETRVRVERLFACEHPYLGAAKDGPLSFEEILRRGIAVGRAIKGESDADS